MKTCSHCKKEFPLKGFHKNRTTKDGLACWCKSCMRMSNFKCNLNLRNKLTLEQYDQMFEIQGGVCAICGEPETHKNHYGAVRLSVDHDHKTRKIRELLCNSCNVGLGCFKENSKLLIRAITYLNKHQPEENEDE